MTDDLNELEDTIDTLESELRQHDKNISKLRQQLSMYGAGEAPLWLSNSLDYEFSRTEEIRFDIAQAKRRLEELAAKQRREQKIRLAITAVSVGFVVVICLAAVFLVSRNISSAGKSDTLPKLVARSSSLPETAKQLSLAGVAPGWTFGTYFRESPAGSIVTPNGVSFHLDSNSPVLETESRTSSADRMITVAANVARPKAIHILINLSYGYKCYEGQTVGRLRFNLSNGTWLSYDLIAGNNIREWVNDPSSQQDVVSGLASRAGLYPEVWKGKHAQWGSKVVIDMVSIGIPTDYQQYTLNSITVEDYGLVLSGIIFEQCRQSLYPTPPNERDPGIVVFGIVVDSQ
jgi:hypothetical protein